MGVTLFCVCISSKTENRFVYLNLYQFFKTLHKSKNLEVFNLRFLYLTYFNEKYQYGFVNIFIEPIKKILFREFQHTNRKIEKHNQKLERLLLKVKEIYPYLAFFF